MKLAVPVLIFSLIRNGLAMGQTYRGARRENRKPTLTPRSRLANTEGGELYLGVEDDGKVTGLHPAHRNLTGLTALIANQTSPPLTVRVAAIEIEDHRIARIMVPKSRQLVATSEGLLQRRRLKADGRPECVPFYPHEFARRQSDLGLLDYSALPMA